ncbi:MAG TPA: hypothetical protein VF815_15565 [Myxococcaceae bacterium]|jgi:hypothetical protein
MDEEALEAGAVAESLLALSRIWSVASGANEVGTQLSFTFWSERGALTLTSYSARGRSGSPGEPVDGEALQENLAKLLTQFAQRHQGMVSLVLERQQAQWLVTYSTSAQPRPPEAKTLPVRRAGLPRQVVESVTDELGQCLKGVKIPAGGEAQIEVEFLLEDDRIEERRLRLFEVTHQGTSGAPRSLSASVLDEATAVLLPFTQGVGERTVHLRLKLVLPPGARHARGWVEEASIERPLPSHELDATLIAEYRAMHEDILRRWREEAKEGATWVAHKGAEELVLWYAGGVVARGFGWLGGRVAPTVLRALQRSKEAGTGWLRTTLARLPVDKRQAFERLWMKVQLEGKRSLSSSERHELRELMQGIEQLIQTPLDTNTKNKLRADARETYKKLHPHLAQLMDRQRGLLPIHHRRQLEYAHLFPEDDINATDNLILVMSDVHDRVNALWTKFRRARPQATAEDVERMARAIDDQFKHWYHQPREPPALPYSLAEAEQRALKQLRRLFPGLE